MINFHVPVLSKSSKVNAGLKSSAVKTSVTVAKTSRAKSATLTSKGKENKITKASVVTKPKVSTTYRTTNLKLLKNGTIYIKNIYNKCEKCETSSMT